jgi:tRNA 2-selenouridine synthase SelU
MPNFSLVYTVDHSLENEKIHLLPGADIGKTLKKQIEKNSLEVAVFNQELWDKYLQEKIS